MPSISTAGTCCMGFNVLYCSVSLSTQRTVVRLIQDLHWLHHVNYHVQYDMSALILILWIYTVPADLRLWLDWLEPGHIQYLWEQTLVHEKQIIKLFTLKCFKVVKCCVAWLTNANPPGAGTSEVSMKNRLHRKKTENIQSIWTEKASHIPPGYN